MIQGSCIFAYFVLGLVQFVFAVNGFTEYPGAEGVFAWIIGGMGAAIVAWIPLIGGIAGIYSAVMVWGIPLLGAVAFFFGVPIALGIMTVAAAWFEGGKLDHERSHD